MLASDSATRGTYNRALTTPSKSDALYWFLGTLFGIVCGYTHVSLNDSGLAVLFVTGAAMFLAYRRPTRIWRWMLLIGLSLPAATLLAQLSRERPSKGLVAGSFAGLAFAIVASFGGQVLHRVVGELFPKKESSGESAN